MSEQALGNCCSGSLSPEALQALGKTQDAPAGITILSPAFAAAAGKEGQMPLGNCCDGALM